MSSPPEKIKEHAQAIWNVIELLGNQKVSEGDIVSMSKGALQLCCNQIDEQLSDLLDDVRKLADRAPN